MRPDTHVQTRRVRLDLHAPTHGVVRFHEVAFVEMCRVLGADLEDERAALVGVSPKTLARTRIRGYASHDLISHVLLGLEPYRDKLARAGYRLCFSELFVPEDTLVPKPQSRMAVA